MNLRFLVVVSVAFVCPLAALAKNVASVSSRVHWFKAGPFQASCAGYEKVVDGHSLPMKVLAFGPDRFMGFGYGKACFQDLNPKSDHYHDLACTRSSGSKRVLPALWESYDAGQTFTCTVHAGIARYHASYGTVGEGTCKAACVVSGQVPSLDAAGVVSNASFTKDVSCYRAGGQLGPAAPPLPFVVLRATVVEFDGKILVIGGLRSPGDPAGPLALQYDSSDCSFVGGWSVVPGIDAAVPTDGRMDLWSTVVDAKDVSGIIVDNSTLIGSTLIVGGGYKLPPSEALTMAVSSYAAYYGVAGDRYEQSDIYTAQGPVKTGSCGGPDCFAFTLLHSGINSPLRRPGQIVSVAVAFPTQGGNQLIPDGGEAQLVAISEASVFVSGGLFAIGWNDVQHYWWLDGFFDPSDFDHAPASDHCVYNTVTVLAGGPNEPLLWCLYADAASTETWRGFARQCTTCGFGSYQAIPCARSPLDNVCRPCTACNRDLSAGPLQYQIDMCQTGLDTMCGKCKVCRNGTLQECGEQTDAICLSPSVDPEPEPVPIVRMPAVTVGSVEAYGIAMGAVLLPAFLALFVSLLVLRDAAHGRAAQRKTEVESWYATFKRAVRRVRLVALPAATVVSYGMLDVGAALASRTSGLDRNTTSYLVSVALAGGTCSLLAVLLNMLDFSVWLTHMAEVRVPTEEAQTVPPFKLRAQAFMLFALSWFHTFPLHHLRRTIVTSASPDLLLATISAFPCCVSGRRSAGSDKSAPAVPSSWRDSPSPIVWAMKVAMFWSCLLDDGVHLASVFYTAVGGDGDENINAVPLSLAAGVVLCAVFNITLVSTSIRKQSRLVGEAACNALTRLGGNPVVDSSSGVEPAAGASSQEHKVVRNPTLAFASVVALSPAGSQAPANLSSSVHAAPSVPVVVVPSRAPQVSTAQPSSTEVPSLLVQPFPAGYGLYSVAGCGDVGGQASAVQAHYPDRGDRLVENAQEGGSHKAVEAIRSHSGSEEADNLSDGSNDHPLVRLQRVRLMMQGVPAHDVLTERDGVIMTDRVPRTEGADQEQPRESSGSSYRSESSYGV